MVQQTDTKLSKYVLANTETGLLKNDNKTSLRDLQYENRNMVQKSDESAILKENRTSVEAVKVLGVKRPHPESAMTTTPQQQTTTASSTSVPLVYVRRKTESDQHKNNTCNKATDELKKSRDQSEKYIEQCQMNDSTVCIDKDIPKPKTSEGVSTTTPLATLDSGKSNMTAHDQSEKYIEQCQMNDSTVCIDKAIPKPKTSEGVSTTKPLATLDSGKSNMTARDQSEKYIEQCQMNDSAVSIDKVIPKPKTSEGISTTTPLATLDSGKSNMTAPAPVADSSRLQLDNAKGLSFQHWEDRFERLQHVLKALDMSNQDDYRRTLRTLSSVGLSKIAVELEKRSIQLSLEEARELQRAKLVNVLNNFPSNAVEPKSMK